MADESIEERLWLAIRDLKRRGLEPTGVYLGGHEYALLRTSGLANRGALAFATDGAPDRVMGIPFFRVSESRHFAVVHS